MTHYAIVVNEKRDEGDAIAFVHPAEPVRIELLDLAGDVLRKAEVVDESLLIDTRGIKARFYILRVSKAEEAIQPSVQLRIAPPVLSAARLSAAFF